MNIFEVRKSICSKLNELIKDPKYINKVDKIIFNYCLTKRKDKVTSKDLAFIEDYKFEMYSNLSLILDRSFEKIYLSELPLFQEAKFGQEQEDLLITTPLVVEEGVEKCFRCNSNRTFSYELQTRSGDEGITTFLRCAQCNNKWRL
jgi:DNA-directed RNA polymerase subunit M/transcription elongation factor TFIIS